jgi:hypothetical protein
VLPQDTSDLGGQCRQIALGDRQAITQGERQLQPAVIANAVAQTYSGLEVHLQQSVSPLISDAQSVDDVQSLTV